MESIDLSVIIACYNVSHFLRDCLDSVQMTAFPKDRLEVILVDDGSTDGTSDIIDQYAEKYDYFHAYHKENGGISTTRNYGMEKATGKYIAFVDGDDIVPADAYTNLMYTAEVNHADVVAGFVNRFNSLKQDIPSYLHSFAIKDNRNHLTLDRAPELLYDTTVWNKVYNRQFLIDHQIKFKVGIIYEDIPFTLEVHLASQNTSTIKNVVYQWRWRETSDSITQSRNALNNYQNRLNALNQCSQLLITSGYDVDSKVYKTLEKKVLTLDLAIFLDEIGNAEEDYVYKVQELTYLFLRYWNLWDSPLIKEVPLKQQLQYYAIKHGDFQLLTKYTYVKNVGKFKQGLFNHHPKFFFPTMKHADVLNSLSYCDNMFPNEQILNRLNVNLKSEEINGNGMFRISRLPMTKKIGTNENYNEKISAKLINIENNKAIKIDFARKTTPLYKRVLKPNGLWTNSRYRFNFNYKKAADKLGAGIWMIKMNGNIANKFKASRFVGDFARQLSAKFDGLHTDKYRIKTDFNTNNELTFGVFPLSIVGSDNVNWINAPKINAGHLIFNANVLDANNILPILKNAQMSIVGNFRIDKTLDFDLSEIDNEELLDQNLTVVLRHKPTNKTVEYLYDKTQAQETLPIDKSQQFNFIYNLKDGIHVIKNYRPIKIQHYKMKNNVLTFNASFDFNVVPLNIGVNSFKIELINKSKSRRYLLTTEDNEIKLNHNKINFVIKLTDKKKKQLNVLAGNYLLTAYAKINGHVRALSIKIDNELIHGKKDLTFADKDIIKYAVESDRKGSLHLKIQQPFYGFADKKRSRRALSFSLLYPLMRHLPLKKVAVFDSYWASQFSSNEKAIYEYLQNYDPSIKTVWFFNNRQIPIDHGGQRVRTGTLKYWYYLATAKYLFQNTNFPNEYLKRKNQIEVETLHGTFLKHMGFDEPHFRNSPRKIQMAFARRNRRWDYLVVPSDYMAKTAANAFDYHQKIIRSGFPRNDELYTNNNSKYIESIKHKLNVPVDKKVVLYAPTYRNDGGFDFELDLEKMKQNLSDEYVILVRLHYFVAHSNHFYNLPNFVYDVSDYNNINDLYLISDVLITDYSSVMFDYAHLQRPMIFFAYDKDWYLDNHNRGVYLDYERQMPGPIVKTNSELIKWLSNFDQLTADYHDKLQKFHDLYAEYGNNGDATQQVVETVINTHNNELDQEIETSIIFNKFWHLFKIKDLQAKVLKYLGRHLPKRKIVIFDSFFGMQYSDNPKAIYQYMRDNHPEYKLYWDANPEKVDYFKEQKLPYIKRFGYRGIFKQAQAKYFVTNVRRPFRWKVPQGSKVLQTWHGTPLKKIGTDVSLVTMPGSNAIKYHQQVYRDAKRWNYLIAPNEYSNQIMQRTFQMDANQMLLTGYPRNDILVNADQEYIDRIKQRLNISPNKKVILYAPTWRDNEFIRNDEFVAKLHLDLNKIKQHFGNKVKVLIRAHYLISNQLDLSDDSVAIDCSDYPDISDLYLISDVLITDYSSVMFDYSILKRPMIFFAYDFDKYANNTRGFYFDFRKEAPGPIVKTNDEVISALDNVFDNWQLNEKYLSFINKYDQWMDGHATQRVVEQLLNDDNVYADTDVNWKQWGLEDKVKLHDGAILWKRDKDFTNSDSAGFIKNYNEKEEWFEVLKGMQIRSTSFNEPLGLKYVLVRKDHLIAWVYLNDINR